MNIAFRSLVFLLLNLTSFLIISSGCISKQQSSAQALTIIDKSGSKARIKSEWQQVLLTQLSEYPSPEATAYGLFSYSGWADQGQRFLISSQGQGVLYSSKVGSSKIDTQVELSTKELDAELALIETFHNLEHFDSKAFDGIQFEYLYVVKDTSSITIEKRVFMNNPNLDKGGIQHQKAIQAFLSLEEQIHKNANQSQND